MAIGEAACVSVHGANRLGSNSLIDLVVFGRAAAHALRARRRARREAAGLPKDAGDKALAGSTGSAMPRRHADGGIAPRMQKVMQENCAVFRTGEVLEEGVARSASTIWKGVATSASPTAR
jgi:succinate dehydrogenase / fumarate reductase, flavoprotein subunit